MESESGGRWTIPRESRTVFKNHADHVFGGQTWLDVLSQMGGCPSEFVDCWNLTIDSRLQAAISPRLVCHARKISLHHLGWITFFVGRFRYIT